MALIKCPECKKEVSDKAEKCPSCGYAIEKEEKSMGCFGWAVATILLLLFVPAFMDGYKNGSKKLDEAKGYDLSKDDTKLATLKTINVKRVHTKNKMDEDVDFLLYEGSDKDVATLRKVVEKIRSASTGKYILYDDLDLLDFNWLAGNSATLGNKYKTKVNKILKQCICAIDKHLISADGQQYEHGVSSSYNNKSKCKPCNIKNEIKSLKDLEQSLLLQRKEAINAIQEHRAKYVISCEDTIKAGLRFPEKVEFSTWKQVIAPHNDFKQIKISGTLEAMNGMGLMIPSDYYCIYNAKTSVLEDANIIER